jgi:hypothetical protein
VEAFRYIDDPFSRLYRVPDTLDFPGSSDFGRARAKYAAKGGHLWLLIDADDWGPQLPVPGRRGAAGGATAPRRRGGPPPPDAPPGQDPRPLRDRPVRDASSDAVVDGWTGDYYQGRHPLRSWHGGGGNPFQVTVRHNILRADGNIKVQGIGAAVQEVTITSAPR